MKGSTTLLLIVVGLILGGFLLFQKITGTGINKQHKGVICSIDPEAVSGVTIMSTQGKATFQRDGEHWKMVEPVKDRADDRYITHLLKAISEMTSREYISESEINSEDVKVSDLGFVKDGLKLTLKDGKKELASFEIGRTSPTGGAYLKVENQPGIFVGSTDLRNLLDHPFDHFRDNRLLLPGFDEMIAIQSKSSKGEIELSRDNGGNEWNLINPLQTTADKGAVEALVKHFTTAKIHSFVPEEKETAGTNAFAENPITVTFDLQKVKEDAASKEPPIRKLTLECGANVEETPELIYARISNRDTIFKIAAKVREAADIGPSSLRGQTLARLHQDQLNQIVINPGSADQSAVELVRVAGIWFLKEQASERQVPANTTRIIAMLHRLNTEQVLDFVNDTAIDLEPYGLAKPFLQLSFRSLDDDPIDPASGQLLKLGRIEKGDIEKIYANFDGQPYVYEVDPSLITSIPVDEIKFKSLNLFNFNVTSLKELAFKEKDSQRTLKYDYLNDTWQYIANGKDLTDTLNKARAHHLAAETGTLTASDWLVDRDKAFEMLENPDLILTVRLAGPEGDTSYRLDLVAVSENPENVFYYGRLEGSPLVFLLDSEAFEKLNLPLSEENEEASKPAAKLPTDLRHGFDI